MLNRLVISLIGICLSVAYGQEYTHYTTKEGLPSNHIYHTIQDSKGFIWFATNRGITKFDGVKFKNFTTKNGLPNNDIWKLTADHQGRVWYNTNSKYQGYIKNDSVYKFMTTDRQTLTSYFWKRDNGNVLLFDRRNHYLLKNDSFQNLNTSNFLSDNTEYLKINRLYNITKSDIVTRYDPDLKKIIFIKDDRVLVYDTNFKKSFEVKLNSKVTSVNEKGNNYMYGLLPHASSFYSNQFGLVFFNLEKKTARFYSAKMLSNQENLGANPLCISVGNNIQVSFPGHLFIFNHKFEIIKKYTFPNFPNNLNSYKDLSGNIWLNNKDNGITLLPITYDITSNFLNQKRVQKINKIGEIIISGVYDDGIYSFNQRQNSFVVVEGIKTNRSIYQIKKNKETLQIASEPSYSLKIDSTLSVEPVLVNYSYKDNRLPDLVLNSFKDIEIIRDTSYLLCYDILMKCDIKTMKNVHEKTKTGLLFIKNFKNSIYAGGSDGLYAYKNDTFLPILQENNLFQTSISSMTSDSTYLYVGTDGRGIYLYDGEKEIYLEKTDGLIVQKIIRKNNLLWLATQEGVKVISLKKESIKDSEITNSFYESDGLPQNNTNDIFLEDSSLWVATDIGLSRLALNNSIFQKTIPIVFDFNSDTVTYQYSSTNQVSANFHALDYVNQQYLTYEYRLLPSTKEWKSTNPGILNFSGLSPSIYTLEVRVADQHNNQSIGKQYIQILPAWWQTTWAKIGFVVSIGLILFLIIRYIQLTIRVSEHRKAERKTKLAGLELQALRSQMNPHFVHNSLNAIKYYIQRNEVELSEEYLVKFSKLIRLFFEFSRRENIILEEEIDLLTVYLHIEKLRFEEKLSYEIIVDDQLDIEDQLIPSMILQPIVENAVNHGLFHKKEKGKVTITIKSINSYSYYIIIEDDGIGINKAREIYDSSSENYRSKSSEVLQERLELLKRNDMWDITYEIVDLSEKNLTQGTRVNLTFKQIL